MPRSRSRAHGFAPRRLDDVGVAGLHRLLAHLDDITAADAVVVVAGMEGALASVIGGLTGAPVVAVPTSVGYGSSLEGVTALLAMHASCAAASRSSASTTASARPARSPGCCRDAASPTSTPSAGVAGDMLLGALVDAGADPDAVCATLAGLGVDGYALTFERVQRGGIAATWANVVTDTHDHDHDHDDHDHDHHEHRPAKAITALLDAADLPDAGARHAPSASFDALAAVEGAVHGIDPADVEFHEVGARRRDRRRRRRRRRAGRPRHRPHRRRRRSRSATARRARPTACCPTRRPPSPGCSRRATCRSSASTRRWSWPRPTGVAVLVALAERFGPLPAMTVERVGYGAGTADPAGRPNVVQVVVGTAAEPSRRRRRRAARPSQLEANVDDVTGEVLAHTIAALLAAGAHDAWATPIVMKKGRPAHTVARARRPRRRRAASPPCCSPRPAASACAPRPSQRWPQRRDEVTVDVDGHPVRVKVAGRPGQGRARRRRRRRRRARPAAARRPARRRNGRPSRTPPAQ